MFTTTPAATVLGHLVAGHAPADGQFPYYVDMFFDTDNDPATGYPALGPVGSELLIESGFGYQGEKRQFQ